MYAHTTIGMKFNIYTSSSCKAREHKSFVWFGSLQEGHAIIQAKHKANEEYFRIDFSVEIRDCFEALLFYMKFSLYSVRWNMKHKRTDMIPLYIHIFSHSVFSCLNNLNNKISYLSCFSDAFVRFILLQVRIALAMCSVSVPYKSMSVLFCTFTKK